MFIYVMCVKEGERKERGRGRERERRRKEGREGERSTHQHGLSERLACQALELAVL